MTVIANFMFQRKCPVSIGDILITGPPVKPEILLPTIGKLETNVSVDVVPKGVRQKLAIIPDYAVIGWSGEASVAGDLISEIIDRSESQRFDADTLRDFCGNQTPNTWDKISIQCSIAQPTNSYRRFAFGNQHVVDIPGSGDAVFAGTGAETLAKLLTANPNLPEGVFSGNNVCFEDQINAYVLSMTGILLTSEVTQTGPVNSLQNRFGGGYEIALPYRDTFFKRGDVTYVYWKLEMVDDNEFKIQVPHRAIRYAYQNDLLMIHTAVFTPKDNMQFDVDQGIHFVEPVYRRLTPQEINAKYNPPSMNATWMCHYIQIVGPGKKEETGFQSYIEALPQRDTALVVFEESEAGNILQVKPNPDVLGKLLTTLWQTLRQEHGKSTTS